MARLRDRYAGPTVDPAAKSAGDDAMAAVARARNFPLEWPTCELAVLVSLAGTIAARLPDTTARCRGDGLSWTEIGDLLGSYNQKLWMHHLSRGAAYLPR